MLASGNLDNASPVLIYVPMWLRTPINFAHSSSLLTSSFVASLVCSELSLSVFFNLCHRGHHRIKNHLSHFFSTSLIAVSLPVLSCLSHSCFHPLIGPQTHWTMQVIDSGSMLEEDVAVDAEVKFSISGRDEFTTAR